MYRHKWGLAGVVSALAVALAAGTYVAWRAVEPDRDGEVATARVLGEQRLRDGHYSYVLRDGEIRVYAIDRSYALVKRVSIPERYALTGVRGVAADAQSDRLYLAYWGADPGRSSHLLAYDLRHDVVLWQRKHEPSTDSIALSGDGRKLYVPCGEEGGNCDYWRVVATADGAELARIRMHEGAHNTIVSLDGDHAYLASLNYNRVAVVDTRRDRIVRWIGPFGDSVRPFTINRNETLLFATVDLLSGFEVADARNGRMLYRIQVRGFPLAPGDFPALPRTQTHGIALTPDETEVWIVDDVYRHLHVFDVRGLPGSAPRQIADIQLGDVPKWINFTRDGRFAHVSTGEIVDRVSRRVVALVEPSRQYLQIDWADGQPVRAYSRHGLGYSAPHS